MSIASEITRLQGVKSDILRAIADRGVEVPSGSKLDACPGLIASISGGGGGATLGDVHLQACVPVSGGIKVVDKNGYIGGNFYGAYYPQSYNFYNNFVIVDEKADFSNTELGQVTLLTPGEDEIGGRKYKTVTIGNQTWLAENLDFKFSGCNIGNPSRSYTDPKAAYYNDDETNYGVDGTYKCGLMYNWAAANFLNANKSTLIPGWHVPYVSDFDTLNNTVGGASTSGTVLSSVNNSITSNWPSNWNGTDAYQFNLLPAGRWSDSFVLLGKTACLWSADSYDSNNAPYFYRNSDMTSFIRDTRYKYYYYSLRLVKDSN